MDTKHLFTSKTFWMNIVGLAMTLGDVLPPKYAAIVLPAANIAMRLISSQPVNLFPPSDKPVQ